MARGSDGASGGGTGRVALLLVALIVVVAAIAWLMVTANREVRPSIDIKAPAAEILPDRTPTTPPAPLPTPSG